MPIGKNEILNRSSLGSALSTEIIQMQPRRYLALSKEKLARIAPFELCQDFLLILALYGKNLLLNQQADRREQGTGSEALLLITFLRQLYVQ
jgi:hypothetical protein